MEQKTKFVIIGKIANKLAILADSNNNKYGMLNISVKQSDKRYNYTIYILNREILANYSEIFTIGKVIKVKGELSSIKTVMKNGEQAYSTVIKVIENHQLKITITNKERYRLSKLHKLAEIEPTPFINENLFLDTNNDLGMECR